MKCLLYILGLILLSPCLLAQTPVGSKISGTVIDQSSLQPVDYATVSLYDISAGKVINGASSDIKGSFTISAIPAGNYMAFVDFIGYRRDTIRNIVITGNKSIIALGTIALNPLQTSLTGVDIVAKAPVVENKIDKMVFNAANDLTSQGGTTLDILKKVPQVTVDVDGNVELQGNSNIRFLINGKPSSVFGNSISDALATIPASQIKSIEVITSPGARYDAEGTGGIINIILKDNKVQGVNGNISLSAGSRLENGSASLNIRKGNFGINAYASGNTQLSSHTPSSQDRSSFDTLNSTNTLLHQDGYTDVKRSGYNGGIGIDWGISKKDNFTANVSFNHFGNQNQGFIGQRQTITDNAGNIVSDLRSFRNSGNNFHSNSTDFSLGYKRKFAQEGCELNFLYSASLGSNFSDYSQSQQYVGAAAPFSGSSSSNPGTDKSHNISIDYTQPIGKRFTLEAGGKIVLNNISSTADVSSLDAVFNEFQPDPSQSYSLHYKRRIYAGYLSGSFSLLHFLDVKAGARFEHTNTTIDYAGTAIPAYNTFIPAIVISHSFDQWQSVKISYTRRIERPEYRELNPFLNLSDPYNISTGNPLLKPEIGNNFELGYNRSFPKGGYVYVAISSRYNSDDIKPYTTFYPQFQVGDSLYSNVSVLTRQNIGYEINTGVNLSGSVPIGDRLNLRSNISVFDRYVVNKYAANNTTSGLNYRINLNSSYQFNNDFVAELFGNYNSGFNNIQGKNPQFFTYTLALRKQFLNKKASIGLTTTNIFNKYVNQVTTVYSGSYASTTLRQVPIRSAGISFAYKFGKLEFKKGKEEDANFQGNIPSDQ